MPASVQLFVQIRKTRINTVYEHDETKAHGVEVKSPLFKLNIEVII